MICCEKKWATEVHSVFPSVLVWFARWKVSGEGVGKYKSPCCCHIKQSYRTGLNYPLHLAPSSTGHYPLSLLVCLSFFVGLFFLSFFRSYSFSFFFLIIFLNSSFIYLFSIVLSVCLSDGLCLCFLVFFFFLIHFVKYIDHPFVAP